MANRLGSASRIHKHTKSFDLFYRRSSREKEIDKKIIGEFILCVGKGGFSFLVFTLRPLLVPTSVKIINNYFIELLDVTNAASARNVWHSTQLIISNPSAFNCSNVFTHKLTRIDWFGDIILKLYRFLGWEGDLDIQFSLFKVSAVGFPLLFQ